MRNFFKKFAARLKSERFGGIYRMPVLPLLFVVISFANYERAAAQVLHTNLLLTAAFKFTAYVQQPSNEVVTLPLTKTQNLATKDLIAAIGTDLGYSSNDLKTAKIMAQFVALGDTNRQEVLNLILRTSSGDTNINNLMSLSFPNFLSFLNNVEVKTSRPNINGTETRTSHLIGDLGLGTTNLNFQTRGRAQIQESSVSYAGKSFDKRIFPSSYNFTLSGYGSVGTNSALFSGSATITGRKIEIAPNLAPSITISSPTNGNTFPLTTNITLRASAIDTDGGVKLVEYFQGDTKLGQSSVSPYTFIWTNAPAGAASISAKATDIDDATAVSSPVVITITSP